MSFKKEFLYGFVIPSVLLLSTSVVALEDDVTVSGADGQPLKVMKPVHREPTDPIGMGSGGRDEIVDDADEERKEDGRTHFPEAWTGHGHAAPSHDDGSRRHLDGKGKKKEAAHGKKTPPGGIPVVSDDEDDQKQRGRPAKEPKPTKIGGKGGLPPQYADHDAGADDEEEIFVPSGHPARQDDAAPRHLNY